MSISRAFSENLDFGLPFRKIGLVQKIRTFVCLQKMNSPENYFSLKFATSTYARTDFKLTTVFDLLFPYV